jgi:hypothetical protein
MLSELSLYLTAERTTIPLFEIPDLADRKPSNA